MGAAWMLSRWPSWAAMVSVLPSWYRSTDSSTTTASGVVGRVHDAVPPHPGRDSLIHVIGRALEVRDG